VSDELSDAFETAYEEANIPSKQWSHEQHS